MRSTRIIAALTATGLVLASPAAAQMTLADAFVQAYQTSPTLRADREGLKILDEDVSAARAAGRPNLVVEGTFTRAELDVEGDGYIVGSRLTQPLFRGFRVANNVKAAKANVRAGRESLRQSEIDLFREIAEQYSAVLRDREILSLNEDMIGALSQVRAGEQRRLDLGERTRTDVAQSDARLAEAQASISRARQRVLESATRFRSLVGVLPDALAPRQALPQLPSGREQAIETALQFSPRIRQKKLTAEVARHQVNAAKGALLPTVDLVATANTRDEIIQILGRNLRQDFATLQAVVTIPIFQGGAEYAAVRRAKHSYNVRVEEIEEESRQVYADAAVAWDRLMAAQQARAALAQAITANATAVSGVKREAISGYRTTLDVLDAERELRDARIAYAHAVHDEFVAAFGVISALGTATAADFNLEVDPYDPEEHYRRAAGRWIGFGP